MYVELIVLLASVLLFGVSIGKILGERSSKEIFKPIVNKYLGQKDDMWKKIRRRI